MSLTNDQKQWIIEVLDYLHRESGTYPGRQCDCEVCQEALDKMKRGRELFNNEVGPGRAGGVPATSLMM